MTLQKLSDTVEALLKRAVATTDPNDAMKLADHRPTSTPLSEEWLYD